MKMVRVSVYMGSATVNIPIRGEAERLYDKWYKSRDDDDFCVLADYIVDDVAENLDFEIEDIAETS